jgi:hypothetical protein
MKWTIRIELTPDGNEPITRDVGTMTRPIADFHPEQVGLSPEEDRQERRRDDFRAHRTASTEIPMIPSIHWSSRIFGSEAFVVVGRLSAKNRTATAFESALDCHITSNLGLTD